ncbi:MAG: hypothetical protein HZC03_02630 [Candidatus Lloydbacteria bacterium]|nr:hypothetical protein [Candidatus Lloydbacteria bacterium]
MLASRLEKTKAGLLPFTRSMSLIKYNPRRLIEQAGNFFYFTYWRAYRPPSRFSRSKKSHDFSTSTPSETTTTDKHWPLEADTRTIGTVSGFSPYATTATTAKPTHNNKITEFKNAFVFFTLKLLFCC